MPLLALALATPVTAQQAPSPACTAGEIYVGGAPEQPSYRWMQPAAGLTPATQKVLREKWTLTCPTYELISTSRSVTVRSLTGRPQDALTPLRPLQAYGSGYYRYPALRLEWIGQSIDLTWNGKDAVTLSGNTDDSVIVALRSGDAPLRLVNFTRQQPSLTLPADQSFELHIKLQFPIIPPPWAAITYQQSTGTLTLERTRAFPDR